MSQYNIGTIDPSTMSGTALAAALNALIPALESSHKGPSRPGYVQTGMLWIDDSGSDWLLNLYDGVDDTIIATIDPTTHTAVPIYVFASQAEAEGGTAIDKPLNSLRVAQAIAALSTSVPAGTVAHFAGQTPPTGWLERNGAAISRTTYASLFAVIGTTFGAGNGSTTFNLPDDRAYFDRGWDHGRGVDSGRAFGSYQADDNLAHTHSYTTRANSFAAAAGSYMTNVWDDTGNVNSGSSGGAEARPKNRAYLPIIKY